MTDTNHFSVKNDDLSIISDITENTSKSSEKSKISKIDLTIIFDANLQKMKIIKLKISVLSTQSKAFQSLQNRN